MSSSGSPTQTTSASPSASSASATLKAPGNLKVRLHRARSDGQHDPVTINASLLTVYHVPDIDMIGCWHYPCDCIWRTYWKQLRIQEEGPPAITTTWRRSRRGRGLSEVATVVDGHDQCVQNYFLCSRRGGVQCGEAKPRETATLNESFLGVVMIAGELCNFAGTSKTIVCSLLSHVVCSICVRGVHCCRTCSPPVTYTRRACPF